MKERVQEKGWGLSERCDRAAITLAVSCGIHCMATPFVVILIPAIAGSFLLDEVFHHAMLAATLPATGIAVFLGWKKHHDFCVPLLAGVGIALLFFAALAGHDLLGEAGERAVVFFGGIALVTGHARNLHLSRRRDWRGGDLSATGV